MATDASKEVITKEAITKGGIFEVVTTGANDDEPNDGETNALSPPDPKRAKPNPEDTMSKNPYWDGGIGLGGTTHADLHLEPNSNNAAARNGAAIIGANRCGGVTRSEGKSAAKNITPEGRKVH